MVICILMVQVQTCFFFQLDGQPFVCRITLQLLGVKIIPCRVATLIDIQLKQKDGGQSTPGAVSIQLTLLPSKRPKLHTILAFLRAIGLRCQNILITRSTHFPSRFLSQTSSFHFSSSNFSRCSLPFLPCIFFLNL